MLPDGCQDPAEPLKGKSSTFRVKRSMGLQCMRMASPGIEKRARRCGRDSRFRRSPGDVLSHVLTLELAAAIHFHGSVAGRRAAGCYHSKGGWAVPAIFTQSRSTVFSSDTCRLERAVLQFQAPCRSPPRIISEPRYSRGAGVNHTGRVYPGRGFRIGFVSRDK